MAKKYYKATFPDGTVVNRSSDHNYKTAWGIYWKDQKRIGTVGFSSSLNPAPEHPYRMSRDRYASANQRAKHNAMVIEKRKEYKVIIVKAVRIK